MLSRLLKEKGINSGALALKPPSLVVEAETGPVVATADEKVCVAEPVVLPQGSTPPVKVPSPDVRSSSPALFVHRPDGVRPYLLTEGVAARFVKD